MPWVAFMCAQLETVLFGNSITGRSNTNESDIQGPGNHPDRDSRELGILPSTEVEFKMRGNVVRLVKRATPGPRSRGSEVLARLKGKANIRMSTDEILALTRK